jgi:phosphoglycolate phosphatase
MKFRCIIFDLDGTLANTIEDIAWSMNSALEHAGFPPVAPEKYPALVGRGIQQLASAVLPYAARAQAAALASMAAQLYAENPLVRTKPYPGIIQLMPELKRQKVKLAVLSNKPDPITQQVIDGLFPAGTFSRVRGAVPELPCKPDPAGVWEILDELEKTPRETIIVGDSEVDMETAHAANCHALAVTWGFRERHILEAAGAERIIDQPEELLALIKAVRL